MRIAVLDDYQRVALDLADWSRLRRDHQVTVFHAPFADGAAAVAALADHDVVCALRERTPFPRAVLEQLPRLRLLVTAGRQNAAIDLAAAHARGVLVCGTDSPSHATPELTLALLLALARHLPAEVANMRAGAWQTTVGRDLRGSTLGLLGLGRLGSEVARLAQAFGMRLIAWSHNLTDERARACGAERVAREALFQQADFVTIHLKLSARTRGLVGAAELAQMRPTAFLVNTSRGPIVDEAALLQALRAGAIAGAALDVYDQEPLPADHPLRREPRALLVPHLGYVTEQTLRVFYGGMVAAIEAWLAGAPIRVLTA